MPPISTARRFVKNRLTTQPEKNNHIGVHGTQAFKS
jgi:hypothetical protein